MCILSLKGPVSAHKSEHRSPVVKRGEANRFLFPNLSPAKNFWQPRALQFLNNILRKHSDRGDYYWPCSLAWYCSLK